VEAEIVKPTAVRVNEGPAKLKQYLPVWMRTPALLVLKPTLGLIVAVIGSVENDWGFQLRLKVLERLLAPCEFNESEVKVACVWNQPYMDFDEFGISAPYSFYLHFGAEGVDKARKFADKVRNYAGNKERSVPLGLLRACFLPECPD
jgi:hypothetical protein